MTSQIDQLQILIDQIDGALHKSVSRFPWAASGQISQQRQVLQQIRSYLIEQRSAANFEQPPKSAALDQSGANAQQVMQSLTQEINELRSTLLRPLQSEVITLTQQRNALMREIRQLESQIHSQSLDRSPDPSSLTSSQVEQLQTVHDRADQVLGTLDTTLRVVFDALQQDIVAYQDSLSQGLAKLHGLGAQGEAMAAALVGRPAQQPGHEASADVPPQAPPAIAESELRLRSTPLLSPSISSSAARASDSAMISLPYPGTELSTPRAEEIPGFLNQSDSIHALTDLLEQISSGTQKPLHVTPVPPPAIVQQPPFAPESAALSNLQSPSQSLDLSDAISSRLIETTYTPHEDLLPASPSDQNVGLDLQLDQSILTQLSEELSYLEREERDGTSSHSARLQSPSSAPSSGVKLSGMDDLFH